MNSVPKNTDCENLPLRVFISYSHTDEKLVDKLEVLLEENGLSPIRDRHFAFGVGFQDQIRRFIEHAHVFMPVVTEESNQRGWVQQEIGYAMAQNIPVLPIAAGLNPGEWPEMTVEPLTVPEREELIEQFLAQFSRRLDAGRVLKGLLKRIESTARFPARRSTIRKRRRVSVRQGGVHAGGSPSSWIR